MKNDKNFLQIAEKFYSIQGEGQTCGTPAVFVRLTGCNILCQSSSWICDTIEVWRKGIKTPFESVLDGELFEKLKEGAHLIITGGEPLLHQAKLTEFLQWFEKGFGWLPVIEVETNGTISPNTYLKNKVSFWNVSPKLTNSGEKYEKRYKPEVIKEFNSLSGTMFKFVISEFSDYEDLKSFYLTIVDKKRIWLMPAGQSREDLNKTRAATVLLCKRFEYNYTDRLHIVIWDKKTGV